MYKQVTIITNTAGSDILSGLLIDYSDGGIVIKDSRDYYNAVKNSIYDNPDTVINIEDDVAITLCVAESNFNHYLKCIERVLDDCKNMQLGSLKILVSDYEESNKLNDWMEKHKPIELDQIIILPEWYDNFVTNKPTLRIKIGSAFGTGQHDSTLLALRLLCESEIKNKSVADLGCGSGILGLSAVILGAYSAYLCDIEDITEARYNASLNGIGEKCVISQNSLTEADIKADIIICNIYAPVLVEHKNILKGMMNAGGKLIISGIYQDSIDCILRAYSDMRIINKLTQGGWWAVAME